MDNSTGKFNIGVFVASTKMSTKYNDEEIAILEQILKECDSITDPDRCEFVYKHWICCENAAERLFLFDYQNKL